MNRTLGIVAMAAALAGTACASRQNVDSSMPAGEPDSIHVETINDNFYDARVHAVYGSGARRALGTIPGNGGTSEVAIPWEPRALVFEISFVISGAAYVTHPIDVTRGESLELRLPPNIDASGFFRRVVGRN
jgi:hypothetical protein